jgi:hypothetical protein
MRVALNYSTLLPKQLRYTEFKQLKELYGVRSKIVHGNYKINRKYTVAGEQHDLDEIAKMSKETLREVIHLFLKDDELRLVGEINGDFWEKRYFNE